MTFPRKGHLFRFILNSEATSDGNVEKLGIQSLQPNRLQTAMFESHVVSLVTSVDRTSFYFQFEHIFSNLVNIHLLISFHFFKVDELLDEHWAKIEQSEKKKFNSDPSRIRWDALIKGSTQELLFFVSGLDIQLEPSKNNSNQYKPMVIKYIPCSTIIWL